MSDKYSPIHYRPSVKSFFDPNYKQVPNQRNSNIKFDDENPNIQAYSKKHYIIHDNIGKVSEFMENQQQHRTIITPTFISDGQFKKIHIPESNNKSFEYQYRKPHSLIKPVDHQILDQRSIDDVAKEKRQEVQVKLQNYSKQSPFDKNIVTIQGKKHYQQDYRPLANDQGLGWTCAEQADKYKQSKNYSRVTNNKFFHGSDQEINWKW